MVYRPDIDGLRAVAVLAVVFFHAGVETFSGGFVGVDIFFVISGFLITQIITQEITLDKFSFVRFYERRARRILPALFAVLIFCSIFTYFRFAPTDMLGFAKSLVSVNLFSSNFYFWKTASYFNPTSELKPLLHTWSLAVEEQFYLIYPFFLLFIWRFNKARLLGLWLVVLLSIAMMLYLAEQKLSASFYLLPTRAWELFCGALTAVLFQSYSQRFEAKPLHSQLASLFGLLLMVYAIVFFDKTMTFPSVHALVPIFGACLVIFFSFTNTISFKLLSQPYLVGIGLISYSVYIWHQPIFSFVRYESLQKNSTIVTVLLILLSIILGYLSYRYIESPFRDKSRFTSRQIFSLSFAGFAVFVGFGLSQIALNGNNWYVKNLSTEQKDFLKNFDNQNPNWKYFNSQNLHAKYNLDCDFYDIKSAMDGHETQLPREKIADKCTKRVAGRKAVMLWGDSHAQQFYFGLEQNLPPEWQILQVASSGCTPNFTFKDDIKNYCTHSNYVATESILKNRPDVVLIAQVNRHDFDKAKTIATYLSDHGVKKVIIIGPVPHWQQGGLPLLVAKKLWPLSSNRSRLGLDTEHMEADKAFKARYAVSKEGFKYVSAVDYFCNEQGCLISYDDDITNTLTTYDYGHLTPYASSMFAHDFLVNQIIK